MYDEEGCKCMLDKVIEKYPNEKSIISKFGDPYGDNFDVNAFGLDIATYLAECLNTENLNINLENTGNNWADYFKTAYLTGCLDGDIEYMKSCKCALNKSMELYPDPQDYLELLRSGSDKEIESYSLYITERCE